MRTATSRFYPILVTALLLTGGVCLGHAQGSEAAPGTVGWTHFRGGEACGVFQGGKEIPAVLAPDKQLVWKAELPGRGPSSPIVVDGHVV
ncbi:MAG: hypothetical protein H5U08_17655, partial [Thermogutta sp.]|nr:hypothetical protein [Thermogutta sp.]